MCVGGGELAKMSQKRVILGVSQTLYDSQLPFKCCQTWFRILRVFGVVLGITVANSSLGNF